MRMTEILTGSADRSTEDLKCVAESSTGSS